MLRVAGLKPARLFQCVTKTLSTKVLRRSENKKKHTMVTVSQLLQDTRLKHYVVPSNVPVVPLLVEEAFNGLNNKERKYAHFISRASWAGTRIVMEQASRESPAIFDFLQAFFRPVIALDQDISVDDLAKKLNAEKSDVTLILQFAAMFYGNMGK
jgi:dipeptidyl-peptidase-3